LGSIDLGVITTLGTNAGLVMDFIGIVLVLGGVAAVALVLGGVAFDLVDDAGEDK
jgi:hypothetical protein